jgi:phosphatidate cytidylyltransferase
MMKRVLTAVIGLPIAITAMYFGGWFFAAVVLIASVLAQIEVYQLFEAGGVRPLKTVGCFLGGATLIRIVIPFEPLLVFVLGAVLVTIIELYRKQEHQIFNVAATFFGILYPVTFLSYFVELRQGVDGMFKNWEAFLLVLTVFLMVAATDTLAYYVGSRFGSRTLFNRISPNKTWEGSIGGLLGAVIVALIMKFTLMKFMNWTDFSALIVICGILSQFGDLVESMFKRSVEVKDSGTLLPGHGGFLDRIDGLLFAAPLVYVYFFYMAKYI